VVDKEYRLPDNNIITVGRERFEAPECLFNPQLVDVESHGISDLLFDAVNGSPLDCQKALIQKVMLTGGTTMFPGLSTRVEKDLKDIYVREKFGGDRAGLSRVRIAVHDPPRRKHGVFVGASFLGQYAPDTKWITRKEYDE
jgi:actin-related protein 2